MIAKEARQQVQRILGVDDDGVFGHRTRLAYDQLATAGNGDEWPPKPRAPKSIELNTSLGTVVKIPTQALDIIKHFESCLQPLGDGTFTSYPDPGYGWDLPTIGWGSVTYEDGSKVKKGDIITQDRADELLMWEVTEKAKAVNSLVKVPINHDQFSALISFAYNVGLEALKNSTLLSLLNGGASNLDVAAQFLLWNKSDGKILSGLTRRRKSESNLFLGENPYLVT